WLAATGDDGLVGLFDPATGKRVGPILTHGMPLLAMTFRPDGWELIAVTQEGHCRHWQLGGSQSLDPAAWQTWLEAATGMRLVDDALVPLSIAEYEDRVDRARTSPLPLQPSFTLTHWHADEAFHAEQAGQLNSARWHLDRWVAREPGDWYPWFRRSHVAEREG